MKVSRPRQTIRQPQGVARRTVLTGMAATAALACSGATRAAEADKRELKLAIITPPQHLWSKSAQSFGETLAARSGGLSVAVYPAGQLGPEAQVFQQMQAGVVDMAFFTMAEITNRLPQFGAFYTPYLVEDVGEAAKLMRGATARSMLADLKAIGLVGLGYGMAGLRQIVSRETITGFGDLSGRKVRVTPFAPDVEFYQLVGAAPTPVPLPQLYDAFANGTVDAMQIDFENTMVFKYDQLARQVTHSDHALFPMVATVSLKTWRGLSAAQQADLQAAADAVLPELLDAYAEADRGYLAALRARGANVVKVERSFFGDVIGRWEERWSARAPRIGDLKAEVAAMRKA